MDATPDLRQPPKARPGDRVAVITPSFPAPGRYPEVHVQGLRRLREVTGLEPVEYPTTRTLDASPQERAADLNAAFADPTIRAVVTTVGGDDQLLVVPHLDADAVRADPKPVLGYSDTTNLLHWLWANGVAAFHGGSTQVHLGPGPAVDDVHARSLRAALLDGGVLEVTDPGESEDHGLDWGDPRALEAYGEREVTEPWTWAGPQRQVTGRTWGGCLEVVDWLALADRSLPSPAALEGAVLLLETSEMALPAWWVRYTLRALGERGLLEPLAGVVMARPAVSSPGDGRTAADRAGSRAEQRDAVVEQVTRYNPHAVVCVGVPFGHTRPQWVLPYGGAVTLDGADRRVLADYGPAVTAR